MNQVSVIGFPRLGEKRELKFAIESFWKGQIKESDLLNAADSIKRNQWRLQKSLNIDYIPANDFSLYDNMLDTATMLNIIPDAYKQDSFSALDIYFALARGYQRRDIDLKSWEMKKWFNTNYHYIVPEINDETHFELNPYGIMHEYLSAKNAGVPTKPVVIGPFTFLKLAKYTQENKKYLDYIEPVVKCYRQLFRLLSQHQVPLLQIDEPILVTELNGNDISSFQFIYHKLLNNKDNLKILLQTYFGDVRDVYRDIISLPFDMVGLDFIEGEHNLDLINKNGFPADKKLFAGVVNGKNIWKNNYALSLRILNKLAQKVPRENIVVSASCSFLHVPYTLENEMNMNRKVKEQLSFAQEKLVELNEIAVIFSEDNQQENTLYQINQEIISRRDTIPGFIFPVVSQRVNNLEEKDFIRTPAYAERIEQQQKILRLPLLPTTTIGSFPQTPEVREKRLAYKKKELNESEYESFIQDQIKKTIRLQEYIGLDVLVHGEYERNDMVEYFGENLKGFVITENGWVQSYGTRGVKPPIILGDVKKEQPITLKWILYAQSLTNKPVKGMLTGPITIYNWSFPREDRAAEEVVYQIALAIKEEVKELAANGIRIIQVDEAAIREKLPLRKSDWHKYLNWAVKAFRLVHSSVKPETQIHTHMCYSDFSDFIEVIKQLDADVLTIEAAKSDLSILASLKENQYNRQIGPGVYDIHSPRIPSVDEIEKIILKMITYVEPDCLWINPDCGLKTRDLREILESLKDMVAAALAQRDILSLSLGDDVDPGEY